MAGATVPAGISQRPTPTVYTIEYCFTAPAACPTAEWTATYTIREVCMGDPAAWTQPLPPVPPNFIGTVVTCDVCEHRTQTITCPVEQAIRTGSVEIHGNGVTATPALAAATATGGAMGAATAAIPGSGSTYGSGVAGSKTGGGAVDISMGGWNSVSGSDSLGSNSGSAAAAAVIGSSSSLESGSSGSNLGLESGSILPTISLPEPNTKSDAASSNYDTADAPSLRDSLVVVFGALAVAMIASQILLV